MITRYKVEEKTTVPNNPNDKAVVHRYGDSFNTALEAEAFIEKRNVPHPEIVRQFSIIKENCSYANNGGYSDITPYEIVRVISDKTKEIRQLDCEKLPWKKDWHEGGFSGHLANQDEQKWDIKSNEENPIIKARLRKDGYFHSVVGKHYIEKSPRKFYDYNF